MPSPEAVAGGAAAAAVTPASGDIGVSATGPGAGSCAGGVSMGAGGDSAGWATSSPGEAAQEVEAKRVSIATAIEQRTSLFRRTGGLSRNRGEGLLRVSPVADKCFVWIDNVHGDASVFIERA